jgi:hypothetical protein
MFTTKALLPAQPTTAFIQATIIHDQHSETNFAILIMASH